ncbi:response regulator [Candidatus Desantisbacteria bacterium]|nr:response regulator [Candidatus Desantisbacteria bacterium]
MPKKVLIVDDQIHIRKIIADKISRAGYIVINAENGQEAVDMAKAEKPDLIIMDIMMPVMNGIEAIKILKQDPDMANIPTLVLTAMELGDNEIELAGIGIKDNDIVTKPFSPKELLDIINARIGEV